RVPQRLRCLLEREQVAGVDGKKDAVEPRIFMQAFMSRLFPIRAGVAFARNPELFEKALPYGFEHSRIECLGLGVICAPGHISCRTMAAIGVHARLDRSTAVVPDRIRRPGIDITLVYPVLIRVEALAHPLEMQFQS